MKVWELEGSQGPLAALCVWPTPMPPANESGRGLPVALALKPSGEVPGVEGEGAHVGGADVELGRGVRDSPPEVAARLPIQVMLGVLGLPLEAEQRLRAWYDVFEAALANFAGDAAVKRAASIAVDELHAALDGAIARAEPGAPGLIADLVTAGLSAPEIRSNLSIIVFGGVSTVEALILNSLYALLLHPHWMDRARAAPELLPQVLEETLRWLSPVQSAIRHVRRETRLGEAVLREGDTVACMLGAANHDPAVFPDPTRFDPLRANAGRHLAFAAGPHMCIGLRLARLEARLTLEAILAGTGDIHLEDREASRPWGYEFRQPRRLQVSWSPRVMSD